MINNFYRFWNYSSYTHTHAHAPSMVITINILHPTTNSVSNVGVEGRSYFTIVIISHPLTE